MSLSNVASRGSSRTISGGAPSFGRCSAFLSIASTLTFTKARCPRCFIILTWRFTTSRRTFAR
eukprot:5562378-Pyramimonas_sp.AAC.1